MDVQTDLILHWVHTSTGPFSQDVTTFQLILFLSTFRSVYTRNHITDRTGQRLTPVKFIKKKFGPKIQTMSSTS